MSAIAFNLSFSSWEIRPSDAVVANGYPLKEFHFAFSSFVVCTSLLATWESASAILDFKIKFSSLSKYVLD